MILRIGLIKNIGYWTNNIFYYYIIFFNLKWYININCIFIILFKEDNYYKIIDKSNQIVLIEKKIFLFV